jgi:hypothetical protein
VERRSLSEDRRDAAANGYQLLREFDAIFVGALGDPRVADNRTRATSCSARASSSIST